MSALVDAIVSITTGKSLSAKPPAFNSSLAAANFALDFSTL
jgi:hypothetical protein